MPDTSLESTPQQSHHCDMPRWWSDSVEDSWNKVKVQVLQEWEKVVDGSKQLDRRLAEEALALGHGARAGYRKLEFWGRDLESRLQQDWKGMTRAAGRRWEDVRDAVKLGWERARSATRPNPPICH